jgi:hypothetical protein
MIQLKNDRLDENLILHYYPEVTGPDDNCKYLVIVVFKVDKDQLELVCQSAEEQEDILSCLDYIWFNKEE